MAEGLSGVLAWQVVIWSDLEVVVVPSRAREVQSFCEGLDQHGVKYAVASRASKAADVVIGWGWRRCRQPYQAGCNVLVLERGYVADRSAWTSVGLNGLNGRARFPPARDGGRRWRRFFQVPEHPWVVRDGPALLIGQVPGDAALEHFPRGWYESTRRALEERGFAVTYRPHPQARARGVPNPIRGVPTDKEPLHVSLARASLVVTWNSNTATEAVIAGVPTITMDRGAIAYPVSRHALPVSREQHDPWPDRSAWMHDLALKQWTSVELERGDAWEAVSVLLEEELRR